MKVYGDIKSGNCYKIKLTLGLLNTPYEWIHIDILKGESQHPDFLAKNPNGKIPLLELNDGNVLTESNAIINYLASDSTLVPPTAFDLALVQQWQFFEQYSHEPFIAVARYINKYLGLPDDRKDEYIAKQAGGNKALQIMEQQLNKTNFLAGNVLTTADISLYAYTHVCDEGGFSLEQYPAIQRWIKRIENTDGYVPMA